MPHASVSPAKDHTNETRRLATLLEISQALSGVLNLKAALHSVLDILERRHQVAGGAVMLVDRDSKDIHVEAAGGVKLPGQRGRNRGDGSGVTERVLDSAKAVVVPRVSQEPNLAPPPTERSRGDQRELSFIAVPIMLGRRPTGTIEVVLPFKSDRDYQRSLEFYRVVASMIAQADQSQPHGRSGPPQAGGRERAPARRAARALCVPQHHRQQRADSAGLRAGGAGRADQHDGAHPRRIWHRQGDDRARDPLQLAARQEAVHQGQRRGAARVADRVRALRLRAGRLHRRAGGEEGPVRARRRRDAVPRRDRRPQSVDPGQAAAGTAGARDRAPRRHDVHQDQRPADRRDASAARDADGRRPVPRRPLLPAGGLHDLRAAASGAEAGHHAARGPLRREVRARTRQAHPAGVDASDRHADVVPLAGERSRAREYDRAVGARVRRRRHPRPPPAADAADGRSLGYGPAPVADRKRRRLRARSPAGRAQDDARQPGPRRAPARHDRTHLQLQGSPLRASIARRFK